MNHHHHDLDIQIIYVGRRLTLVRRDDGYLLLGPHGQRQVLRAVRAVDERALQEHVEALDAALVQYTRRWEELEGYRLPAEARLRACLSERQELYDRMEAVVAGSAADVSLAETFGDYVGVVRRVVEAQLQLANVRVLMELLADDTRRVTGFRP